MYKPRGNYYKTSEEAQLTISPDTIRNTIVCLYELPNKRPNWNLMEGYIKCHTSSYWVEQIDRRQEIFIRMEEIKKKLHSLTVQAGRKGLYIATGIAYPSLALTQEIIKVLPKAQQLRFYDLLLKGILEGLSHCIYIVSEYKNVSKPKSPIYVGQTKDLEQRWAGHKNADTIGFMDYALSP